MMIQMGLDKESWHMTVYVMLIVSISVFLIQRTVWRFLDNIFELCIFHLPTLLAILIYIRQTDPNETIVE